MGWHWKPIVLFALLRVVIGCVVEKESEDLTIACNGSYALKTIHGLQVLPCGNLSGANLCGPLEIIGQNCKTIMIRAPCQIERSTVQIQVIILWVLLSLIMATLVLLALMWLGLHRLSEGDGTTFQLKVNRVIIRDDRGTRVLRYSKLLVSGLLLTRVSSSEATCVGPHHTSFDGSMSTYKFNLLPGSSACFLEGSIIHDESDVLAETSFLYKTAEWKHHTWTLLSCGNGNCGTKEQCSVWGEHGKVVDGPGPKGQYKKFCATNLQPWTSCFYGWGCWLATNEISWTEADEWIASSIGEYTPADDYSVSGLEDCSISVTSLSSDSLRGDYLLTNGEISMICKSAAEEGYPQSGRLGDLQLIGNKTFFDYSAFSCDLATAHSSGNCKVEQSGVLVSKGRCLELPATVDVEHLRYADGNLHVSPLGPREFTIRCPRNLTIQKSDHNCNSIEVEIHGLRSEQDFTFLSFKANSPGDRSSYPIPKDCHMEEVEVPCDGKDHIIRSYSYPVYDCFPSGSSFTDKTVEPDVPKWSWDHEDHYALGKSGSYRSIIVYAVGFLAILILLKIVLS